MSHLMRSQELCDAFDTINILVEMNYAKIWIKDRKAEEFSNAVETNSRRRKTQCDVHEKCASL